MTPGEIDRLYAEAEAECNANEEAMLVNPLVVIALVDLLRRCERQRREAAQYDMVVTPEP